MNDALQLPIVGRSAELAVIAQMRDDAAHGRGGVLLLTGDGGVGKTRLINEASAPAIDGGWQVAVGRAYPLETATPYAPFADALAPILSAIDGGTLQRLTRGDIAPIAALAPLLLPTMGSSARDARMNVESAIELKVRLHTAILQLIGKLAERKPLMLVLENLQWADATSLELFHFLARQAGQARLLLIGTWNDTERELPTALKTVAQSLRSLGAVRDMRLTSLSPVVLSELVVRVFGVDAATATTFANALHEATRGNAFFVEQTLRDLVDRGVLRKAAGVWLGWHVETFAMPSSVRDVLQARTERLGADARRVAELAAVVGNSAAHDVLSAITGFPEAQLFSALDELRLNHVIEERLEGSAVTYDIAHPMLRQSIMDSMGLARERSLHAAVAEALERSLGANATQHADKLAAHWQRADLRANASRAVHWLILAGQQAVSRSAWREAAETFRAALNRADEFADASTPTQSRMLVTELSRLYRRLGEYHEVIVMSERARDLADVAGDKSGMAAAERRLGLACQGLGRRQEAIQHFEQGLALAHGENDQRLVSRLHLAKGDCLQALGMPEEAKREVTEALELAERLDDLPLLARTYRALLMLHLWAGPAHRAWVLARSAVALAEQSGERNLAWSAHWAAAVLGGLTSNTAALQRHLAEATRLADELRSPLLQLRTAEISVEYHSGVGEWDLALTDGERAIASARALDQTTMLARLLNWVGVVYLHRGEIADARGMLDESWRISGAAHIDVDRPFDAHAVLPAFVGRVTYLVAIGEHARAIETGMAALRIASRTGYVAWTVYRLLPSVAEAALALDDTATLDDVRSRLAHDAAWLAHPIGSAWVELIDGERARRDGRTGEAISHLQRAVSALEGVPYLHDAARARMLLAQALAAHGDRDEAVREVRAALQLFETLGAQPSCEAARALLREFGARVPGRRAGPGFDGLTAREIDIVRLVAQRSSNKEVGARLSISARTVGTHLANIFDKVGVRDRTALGDLARERGLHQRIASRDGQETPRSGQPWPRRIV